MTTKRKVLIIAAVILFLAGPFFFFQYSDLLAAAHDRQRCAAEYADFLKYSKFARTSGGVTETQYCERLEGEAWECRFAGIISILLGFVCVYFAITAKLNVPTTGPVSSTPRRTR